VKRYNWARFTGPLTETGVNREFAKLAESINTPGHLACAWRSVTSATTVLPTDALLLCDATGGAFTVTLPEARSALGLRVTIKRTNAGANAVTVSRSGTDTIDGSNTTSLASQYARVTVQAWRDGASYGWAIIST
jgi:hypothetical protein